MITTDKLRAPRRSGFTLVEMMVVIMIIGILMAVAIPAIMGAMRRAREAGIRTEIEGLSQAIEAYKLKYGDYPPDFTDWAIVVRHYRKIFPDIDTTELNVLRDQCALQSEVDAGNANPAHDPTRIDRAEALVWNLGGFSSDTKRPFTGPGGPLAEKKSPLVSPRPTHYNNFGYNGTRDNAVIDFNASSLTMGEYDPANQTALSTEEGTGRGDVFPVYLRAASRSPYLYFDSRTYGAFFPAIPYVNHYESPVGREAPPAGGDWGRLRPYLSSKVVSPAEGVVPTASGGALAFMAPNTFQIISAGTDDNFGSLLNAPGGSEPLYFAYPTGTAYRIDSSLVAHEVPELAKYAESAVPNVTENHHFDNLTSFGEGLLESAIP